MLRKTILIAAVVLLMLSLLASIAWAQGDVERGKELWSTTTCQKCHGENGEGKYAGVRAGDGKTLETWITQSRTPRGKMPSYPEAKLSDADITDMWAYMQTLTKPESFSKIAYEAQAGDHPGKVLWADKNCEACHSNFGEGKIKKTFVDAGVPVTYEAVVAQMRTPKADMPVYGPSQVSDEEAAQIVEFMVLQAEALAGGAAPETLPESGGQNWGSVAGLLALAGLLLLGLGTGLTLRERNRA